MSRWILGLSVQLLAIFYGEPPTLINHVRNYGGNKPKAYSLHATY
jgi:hypothetical protein